ncbi:hypothetical protein GCM10023183_08750 [Nibribacter koreensis]|uniref:Uncharacterized protein n=1 Tax=Nibribacter koreensis TaxID=1084519 RepID=A0ABP8FBT2_9BACT
MLFYILSKAEKLITGVTEQTEDGWLTCLPVHNPKNIDIEEESIKGSEVFNNPNYEVSKDLINLVQQV